MLPARGAWVPCPVLCCGTPFGSIKTCRAGRTTSLCSTGSLGISNMRRIRLPLPSYSSSETMPSCWRGAGRRQRAFSAARCGDIWNAGAGGLEQGDGSICHHCTATCGTACFIAGGVHLFCCRLTFSLDPTFSLHATMVTWLFALSVLPVAAADVLKRTVDSAKCVCVCPSGWRACTCAAASLQLCKAAEGGGSGTPALLYASLACLPSHL